jgi:hypothetical protein
MVPDLDALLLSLADPSAPARRSSRKLQLQKRTTPRLARTAATGLPGASRGRAVNEAGTLVLSARKMLSKARIRAPTQPARHVREKATRRKPGVRAAERWPTLAAAERNDEENGVPEAADEQGLLSLSSEDGGAEEFMAAMKEMAEKRKKQQERDERKVDAFYLANMKRVQKQGEQKVFAISARASEDTREFLADVSAQAQTLIQAARVVENEELVSTVRVLQWLQGYQCRDGRGCF